MPLTPPAACTTSSRLQSSHRPAAGTSAVTAVVTDDGLLVRLTGSVTAGSLPDLRDALLCRPAPPMVLIDAGTVEALDEDALAVLLAASAWVDECGGRLLFATASAAVTGALADLDPHAALPLLPAPVAPAANVRALRPRSADFGIPA